MHLQIFGTSNKSPIPTANPGSHYTGHILFIIDLNTSLHLWWNREQKLG